MGNWRKGVYSDELSGSQAPDDMMKWAIGKTIVCEDGIPRRCHEIIRSIQYPWRYIINEKDPDSDLGYFVNVLSLCRQFTGEPIPDNGEIESFIKTCRAKYNINADGSFDRPPEKPKSPIILLK